MSSKQRRYGVTLTISAPSSNYGPILITDIDVEPGADTVVLDIDNLPQHASAFVQLSNINKQFPDVRTLVFGGQVTSAEISNYMFPNVTNIVVQKQPPRYHRKMLVGRNGCLLMAIKNGNSIEYMLLNTFCKKPGEEIDLTGVYSIKDYALEGCMSTNIINTDGITHLSRKSFTNSAFQFGGSFTNGVKCVNGMIVDIDTTVKEIDIPGDARISGVDIPENFMFDKITIHSKYSIPAIAENGRHSFFSGCNIPCDVLRMDFNNDEFDYAILKSIDTRAFELSEKNRFCTEHDGILYNRSMDTLICCPLKKTGSLIIPEGVKYIGDNSCSHTEITSLQLPDSLRNLGSYAFYGNQKLADIDFGHGIKNIGDGFNDMVFASCSALTSLEIPSNVESIGGSIFMYCQNLSKVTFNEGIENIGLNAFQGCNITGVTFPKSIRKLYPSAFSGVKHANIKGIIPPGFLDAILKTDDGMQPEDLFETVEVTDGQNKLFFPMYLESINKNKLQGSLEYRTLAEVVEDKNFINRPGESSKHIEVKQDLAIKVYGYNQNPEIRTYLRRAATSITKRYIAKKDENRLIEFLKLDLMTMAAMNKILPQVKNAEMTSATAYLLNAINDAGGNKKTFRI